MTAIPNWIHSWREIKAMLSDAMFPERRLWQALDYWLFVVRESAKLEDDQRQRQRIEDEARFVEVQELGT